MKSRRYVLVAALLLVGACAPRSTSSDDAGDSGPVTSIEDATPTERDPALGALTRVTGSVASADLVGTLDGAVSLPIALTVPAGGGGNGVVITGVETAGGNTIVWDGGRPITLSGDGTLAVQPGTFQVSDDGLRADMSGAAHVLSPGRYAVVGPVAVGDGRGLAAPSTQTTFTAGDDAVLSGTGQVEGRLPAGTYLLLGPGRVALDGALHVQTSNAATTTSALTMENGSYEITFTVADDGTVSVEALLDGDVAV